MEYLLIVKNYGLVIVQLKIKVNLFLWKIIVIKVYYII
jgi:hypothetical protein